MKKTAEKISNNKKKINVKIIIVVLILGLIIAVFAVRGALTIRSIDVIIESVKTEDEKNENTEQENLRISKEQVIEFSGLKVGDKLYKYLRSEISKKIEQNPYIEKAEIKRDFSGKLKIIVTQRKHKYMMNYSGEFLYIDREGYVLEVSSENNGDPIIIGLVTDCSSLSVGNTKIRLNKQDLEKLEVVNNIIASMESNGVSNRIYTINVENKDDFVLQLDDDKKSVHIGDGSNLNTRILYMKKILESEIGHSGVIYVNGDLDESYVYFREQ